MSDFLTPLEVAIHEEALFFDRDDDEGALRVTFKSEGDRYFVVAYRDDPAFVMIGAGWSLPKDIDTRDAMHVANTLNVRKKFVKSAIWGEEQDVLFTIELCVSDTDEVAPHFTRLLDVLRDTAEEFFNELRAQREEGD